MTYHYNQRVGIASACRIGFVITSCSEAVFSPSSVWMICRSPWISEYFVIILAIIKTKDTYTEHFVQKFVLSLVGH